MHKNDMKSYPMEYRVHDWNDLKNIDKSQIHYDLENNIVSNKKK